MEKLKNETMEYDKAIQTIGNKVNEIVDKLNDLEQIVYDFIEHIKH
jgi:hypothetical protein